ASLLMARGAARLRELGVRAAIGASRGRLLRQLLTESLVLSSAGAILSVVLGTTVFQWLVRLAPPRAYRLLPDGLEPRAVVFAVAVSAIAGMIFGVIPALRLSKSGVAETQRRDGARVSLGLSGTMVAVEAALGIAPLCAAGPMANSLVRMRTVDLGFEPAGVLTFGAFPPAARYPTPAARHAFMMGLLDRVRHL